MRRRVSSTTHGTPAEREETSRETGIKPSILRFKLRTLTQPLPKGEETCASLTPVSSLGGSIKDDESITAANENGIAMAFTGILHFKHWLDDILE